MENRGIREQSLCGRSAVLQCTSGASLSQQHRIQRALIVLNESGSRERGDNEEELIFLFGASTLTRSGMRAAAEDLAGARTILLSRLREEVNELRASRGMNLRRNAASARTSKGSCEG